MQRMQLDSKELLTNGVLGAASARNIPAHATSHGTAAAPGTSHVSPTKSARGWLRAASRFARNAAIGLVAISALPLAVIVWRHSQPVHDNVTGIAGQLADIDHMRSLRIAADPSITPMQAGMAFRALQLRAPSAEFPTVPNAAESARPWKSLALPKGFEFLDTRAFDRTISQGMIAQSRSGFSDAQLAYLRDLAEAPVWESFDRVARASEVDMIGGLYVLPFREGANAMDMPLLKYMNTTELANAGVSRAAYYLAMKQPAQAEAALRSVVSFGFALIDNGTGALDALIGRQIVIAGRNGIRQYNEVTGRIVPDNENAPVRRSVAPGSATRARQPISAEVMRARSIANATDVTLPQSLRYASLSQLSTSSCGSVRDVMFGPSSDVQAAFENAERGLASESSNRAYLELLRTTTNQVPSSSWSRWIGDDLVMGTASIAAAITRNPRIETCTMIALLGR
jgi:hypothetical protein